MAYSFGQIEKSYGSKGYNKGHSYLKRSYRKKVRRLPLDIEVNDRFYKGYK